MTSKATLEQIKEMSRDPIGYEVALETLGQSRQPFMQKIIAEEAKEKPSEQMIAFCKARLSAIDQLQYALLPDDYDTIEHILTINDPIIGRVKS